MLNRMKAAVKAFRAPGAVVRGQKSVNWGDWLFYQLPNGDLEMSQQGYSSAYIVVSAVRSCVDIFADQIERIPYRIIENSTSDRANDRVVSESTDVSPRHIFDFAASHYRKDNNISLMRHIVYGLMLYDEVYLWVLNNVHGLPAGFRWLSPLYMDMEDVNGSITSYWYSNSNGASRRFTPYEICYDHGFNPFDDLRGSSIVAAAINEININRNLQRFLRDFFINNARPGFAASFKNERNADDPDAQELLKQELRKYFKGSGNQFNTLISPIPLDFETFDPPDISGQYSINASIRREIYATFGVPMALAGDTQATKFKETKDVRAAFVLTKILPLLKRLEDFFNDTVLPRMGCENVRLEFDTTEYNVLTEEDEMYSRMVRDDLSAGLIPVSTAQSLRGYPVDKTLDGIYVMQGRPMTREIMLQVAKSLPEGVQQPLTTPSPNANGTPTNIIYNADGTPVPQDAVFGYHIDSGIVAINEARAQLGLPPTSETDESRLAKLRNQLEVAQAAINAGVSRDQALQLVGLHLEPQIDEMKRWKKFLKANKSREFVCEFIRGDVEHYIRTSLGLSTFIEESETILGTLEPSIVWETAQARLNYDKAIQATRIDYMIRVEDLITEQRAGNLDKDRFKQLMRAMIERYGTAAYVDGLVDGGVIDGRMDDEDRANVRSLRVSQTKFVRDFADVLFDKGISDADAKMKPSIWFNKSIGPFYTAGLASADKNGYYEWVIGPTEEHCKDCSKLNGQIHRMRDWVKSGWKPQSDQLACKGFQCKCNFVKRLNTRASGRLPKKSIDHVHED